MKSTLLALAFSALASIASPALSQVIAVEQIEQSLLIRSAPTLTLLRPSGAVQPRAVLMMMPGGEGQIGLRPDMPLDTSPPRTSFAALARRLVDPQATSGAVHVVGVDSPYNLGGLDVSPRGTRDHLVRMESVAQFYRTRFGLPVWLMGHSNGGYSVAEFVKHLQSRNKEDVIAGIVFSAGREISNFGSGPFRWPALFVVSAEDDCKNTSTAGNERLYEHFKARNAAPTDFVLIRSVQPQNADPCRSGTHMYHRAEQEVAKAIDDFILGHTPLAGAPR